jgi:hypothetical protein
MHPIISCHLAAPLQIAHRPRDLARYRVACGKIDGQVLLTPVETKVNAAPALGPTEDIGRQNCRPLADARGSRSNVPIGLGNFFRREGVVMVPQA